MYIITLHSTMNYNLNETIRTVPGQYNEQYSRDESGFGAVPYDMVMSKFEETDMGDEENIYDDYARVNLTDRRPDTNLFAHEEARGSVNRRYGYLNLIHTGTRSGIDPFEVYKPETFLDGEFLEPDPRGINVDPDFKELRKQHEARTRFVNWTAENYDQITGGGRSESQVMADQQKLFRTVRDRLKVFSQQIDGRREGMRRTYKHKSNVPKQILVQSYGDYIRDYALNPQRRVNIICNKILRDTRAFRDNCTDSDFAFAKYTQLTRRSRKTSDAKMVAQAKESNDGKFAEGDNSICFKTAGLLMANIVKGKKQSISNAKSSDMDFAETKQTVARKTEPFQRDLALILRAIASDSNFAHGDMTMIVKTAAPQQMEHLARMVTYNHLAPAHHYLNAEILYKSVKPGADTRKIKDLVITDANAPQIQDTLTTQGKSAKMKIITGMKLATADDADKSESFKTFNYKTALAQNGDKRLRLTSGEDYKKESDNTQIRRPLHTNYRTASIEDNETDMRFLNNASKERLTGGLGTKYMNRFIERDSKQNEIAFDN